MTCWLHVEATWQPDRISCGSAHMCMCFVCYYILCLTLQHFHSHLHAGLGVSESEAIGGCLDHPAKGSRSKSATWSTKRGSVRRRPWMQHVVVWEVKVEAEQKQKIAVLYERQHWAGYNSWSLQRGSVWAWRDACLERAADGRQASVSNKCCRRKSSLNREKWWRTERRSWLRGWTLNVVYLHLKGSVGMDN